MGAAGTHSNYCVADSGVYVRREGHCLRIDRATGQLLAQFEAPTDQAGQPGIWGFIACEQGVSIGSLADADHVVTFRYVDRGGDMNSLLTESKTLFGMDAESGEVLWRYDAEHSIRHNAIALGQSAVYLIDRPQALEDRIKRPKSRAIRTVRWWRLTLAVVWNCGAAGRTSMARCWRSANSIRCC